MVRELEMKFGDGVAPARTEFRLDESPVSSSLNWGRLSASLRELVDAVCCGAYG